MRYLHPSTKRCIRKLRREGFSKEELGIMFSDYGYIKVNSILRGINAKPN